MSAARTAVLVLGLVLTAQARAVADDDDERELEVEVEAGSEVDTNPHRALGERGQATGVLRATARTEGAHRFGAGRLVSGRLVLAGKKFLGEAGDEDLGVVTGELRGDLRPGDAPLALSLRLSYYDAIERDTGAALPEHDFRTGDATLAVTLAGEGAHRVTLAAGVRAFAYKPDARYDFVGEHADLVWRGHWVSGDDDDDPTADPAMWDAEVQLGVARREYDAPVVLDLCPPGQTEFACLGLGDRARVDLEPHAGVMFAYTGAVILEARYLAALVQSNSFGQSYLRHRVEASLTAELPLELLVTLRGVLQLTQFLDPLLLSRDVGILNLDEENRNVVSLRLARELGHGLTAEARVDVYRNEFATQELRFARETAYLGLLVRLW
jgi:hypothetical protein